VLTLPARRASVQALARCFAAHVGLCAPQEGAREAIAIGDVAGGPARGAAAFAGADIGAQRALAIAALAALCISCAPRLPRFPRASGLPPPLSACVSQARALRQRRAFCAPRSCTPPR